MYHIINNTSCSDMVDCYKMIPLLNKNNYLHGVSKIVPTQRDEKFAIYDYCLCIVLLICIIIINIYDIVSPFKQLSYGNSIIRNIWNIAHHQYVIMQQFVYKNGAVVNIWKYWKFFIHESKKCLTESKCNCKLVTYKIMKLSIKYIQFTKNNAYRIIKLIISTTIRLLFNNSNGNSNNLIIGNNYCNCLEINWITNLLLLTVINYYSNKREKQLQEVQKWEKIQMQQMDLESYRQKLEFCCPIYSCYLYKKLYSTLKISVYIIKQNESYIAPEHNNTNYILIYPNYLNYCYTNNALGTLYACVQSCHSKCSPCSYCRLYDFRNNNYCFNYVGKCSHFANDCQQIYCYHWNYNNELLKDNHHNADYFNYCYVKNSNGINYWNCSMRVNSSKYWNYCSYFYYLAYFIIKSKIILYIFNNSREVEKGIFQRYGYMEVHVYMLHDLKPHCNSQDKKLKQILQFCLPKPHKKYTTTLASYICMHTCNFSIITFQMFHGFLFISLQTYRYNIKHYSKYIKYFQIISAENNNNQLNKNKLNQTFNISNCIYFIPFIQTKFKKSRRSCENDYNYFKSQEVYCKHPMIIIINYRGHIKIQETCNRYKILTKIFTSKSQSTLVVEACTSTNKLNTNVMQRKANSRMRSLQRSKGSKPNLLWLLIGLVWLEDTKFITCNIIINYQYLPHQQQLQPHYQQQYQKPQQQQNTSNTETKTATTKTTYCAHLDPFRLYHHLYQFNNSYNIDIYDIITKNTEFCKNYQTTIQTPADRITSVLGNNNDFKMTLQAFRNNTINFFAQNGLHFIVNEDRRTQSDESRLESIKQQILLKLGFKRKPIISKRLPTDFIWETIYRADGFQGLNGFNNNHKHLHKEYHGDHHLNHKSDRHPHLASIYRMNHLIQLYSTSNFDSKNIQNHTDQENGNTDTKLAYIKQVIQPVYPNYSMGLHSKLYKVEVSKSKTGDQSLTQTLINSNVLSNIKYHGNNFKRNIDETFTYLMDKSIDDTNNRIRDYKFEKNPNVKYRKFPSQKYNVKFKIEEGDDFFGNTREIITFSEKGSLYKQHRLIEFSSRNKEILNQKLIIRSAEIHIRIDRVLLPTTTSSLGRRKVLSNKNKRLKIWIFHLKQTNYTKKGNDQIARFCASFEVNPEVLGWQKIDLTPTVKEWITYQQNEKLHLLIDCTGCGKVYSLQLFENNSQKNRNLKIPTLRNIWMSPLKTEQRKYHNVTVEGAKHAYNTSNRKKQEKKLFSYKFHSDATNSDKNANADIATYNEITKHYDVELNTNNNIINPNRPFLVLHTEPKQGHRVQKRAINCNSVTNGQCCKETFYVSFKALGWDDWIIAPRGYFANYCRGDCIHKFRTPDKFKSFHAHFIEEYRKMGLLNGMKPCCTPIKFSSMSLIYYGDEGIVKRDLPKMVVDECGCP